MRKVIKPGDDHSQQIAEIGHGLRIVVRLGDVRGLRLRASNKVAAPERRQ
jgi:hypothetical protein